jgi:hypothetical protein
MQCSTNSRYRRVHYAQQLKRSNTEYIHKGRWFLTSINTRKRQALRQWAVSDHVTWQFTVHSVSKGVHNVAYSKRCVNALRS